MFVDSSSVEPQKILAFGHTSAERELLPQTLFVWKSFYLSSLPQLVSNLGALKMILFGIIFVGLV